MTPQGTASVSSSKTITIAFLMINPDHVKEIRRRGEVVHQNVEHFKDLLKDPLWRIYNLYTILTKPDENFKRHRIRFLPNEAQCEVLYWIFVLGRTWLNILKARQLGFTTLFQIIGLDKALNEKNSIINFLSETEPVSTRTFKEKAILAYNCLSPDYLEYLKQEIGTSPANINESKIEFEEGWGIYTQVKMRGGTSSMVHISELGPISENDKKKAEEVFSGAIETANPNTITVIESTFKGGQQGIYYKNLKKSLETGEGPHAREEFWFMFFPWYENPEYENDDERVLIKPSTLAYFEGMSMKLGIAFSEDKMRWWQVKADRLGALMRQEHPTTPEEAMSAPVEGAIYADTLVDLEKDGRRCSLIVDGSRPVYAIWDLGLVHFTAIWLVQFVDGWVHWLRYFQDSGEQPSHYVNLINNCGTPIFKNILPHDASQQRVGGSWQTLLRQAGLKNMVRLEKTNNKFVGINYLQSILKRSRFNLNDTDEGWDCLMNYRQKFSPEGDFTIQKTVDDEYTDGADSARYLAEALLTGKIKEKTMNDEARNEIMMAMRGYRSKQSNGFKNDKWWK